MLLGFVSDFVGGGKLPEGLYFLFLLRGRFLLGNS